MPSKNIEDLLSELEAEEKTAEETFANGITTEEQEEEKVAEQETVEETEEVTEEKTASEEETEEEVEEKTASEETEETEEETEEKEEKTASTQEGLTEEQLVKISQDMGKIVAQTVYSELVAMGIMPPTNEDVEVPPVSAVSLPSDSPVTVAADAKHQMGEQQEKKASALTPDVVTNMYNNIFNEDNN